MTLSSDGNGGMQDQWLGPSPRLGEVVESASHKFTAQCYRLYQSPALGAFVRTTAYFAPSNMPDADGRSGSIYAVVCGVSTRGLDPSRPIVARGQEEATEEDVYLSNPHLARLLSTSFEALIVGYSGGAACIQSLPPFPPRIHAFVYPAMPQEVGQFTRSLDFLPLLMNPSSAAPGIADEVIAACLRYASAQVDDPRGFLVRGGKALAVQLARDLPRLNAILKRLSR